MSISDEFDYVGVIPARYHSTRFPGKVLEPIDGLPMAAQVYKRAKGSRLQRLLIATDHPDVFKAIAKDYVCVRTTNINDIDLSLYPFDYDLTMAIFLANGDGTVCDRYGGRDDVSPMNMNSLLAIM